MNAIMITTDPAGELRIGSDVVADRTDVQHKNVIAYVRENLADFEEFGRVAFETRPFETAGGVQSREVAHLNEQQATLLMTFMRNSPVVKAFKVELVKQFYAMRQAVAQRVVPQSLPEALRAYAEEVEARQALEARAAADAPKVAYVDTFVADDDLLLVRTVAKSLGLGEEQLRSELIAHRWIYRDHTTRWSQKEQRKVDYYRYSPYADKRAYFGMVLNHDAPRFRGEVHHTLKVTPAGAEAIARAARSWGLIDAEAVDR